MLTESQRRKAMSHNRGKDTHPEIVLRKALWHRGIRYRKNYRKLKGTPDIAITRYHIAVFVDGDFGMQKDTGNILGSKSNRTKRFGRKN